MSNLINRKEIEKVLNNKYVAMGKGKVFPVKTEGFPINKGMHYKGPYKTVTAWADAVTSEITEPSIDRRSLSKEEPLCFAYVKFAKNDVGEIVGLIGGKSRFHRSNTSDINYSGHEKYASSKNYLSKNKLELYTQEILIVINRTPTPQKAAEDEEWIQNEFSLFTSQKLSIQKGI